MEENYDTDDFLAKWASGELSDAEKEAFEKSDDYSFYQAILEGTEVLEVPPYDKEQLFEKVQEMKAAEKNLIQLIPKWAYAVAASVAILIGTVFFFNQTVGYDTGYGEQLAIVLPDGSEIILNAGSNLVYKKKKWEEERTISLDGEAYFKVNKGSTFTVHTDNGSVTVLGTQFTVNSETNIFEVVCYEGKVKIENTNSSRIITKGEAVRTINGSFENWNLDQQAPSWLQDESSFTNAPLHQVIKALEKQYDITINSNNVDKDLRFTGSFTHNNLETALRTVFESLEIRFTFADENSIHLVIE